ncbi:MAG TPA: hypothetical protein VN426_09325 [Syntrophomonadaceae bacterium]|nr:hypothetical protein [Syntrophomonadaceae bacterium]
MSIITKNGHKRRGFTKKSGLILAILLTLSLGLIGSAMALWEDSLTIVQTYGTGTFKPEFTTNYSDSIVPRDKGESISSDAATATDRTKNTVIIRNAYDNDAFIYNFYIQNNGTVPVKIDDYKVKPDTMSSKVTVAVFPTAPVLDRGISPGTGQIASGTIAIKVDADIPDGQIISVDFPCHQWNLPYSDSDTRVWEKMLTLSFEINRPSS